MDNTTDWSTPMSAVLVCALGGVALGTIAVVMAVDMPGRILLGVAAVGLLTLAALAGLRRPRLSVAGEAVRRRLVVRGLRHTSAYSADRILSIRLSDNRHLGRKNPMLEIDVIDDGVERLLVFTRWDLGVHPADVYDALVLNGLMPTT